MNVADGLDRGLLVSDLEEIRALAPGESFRGSFSADTQPETQLCGMLLDGEGWAFFERCDNYRRP